LKSLKIEDAGYSRHFKYLKRKKLPIPKSLTDQKRIAKVLSDCEQLIAWRKDSIQLLDDYLESVFLEMFGDPVNNKKDWEIQTIEKLVKDEKYSIKRGPFGGALKKEIFVESGYLVYEQYHALNDDFDFGRYFIDQKKFEELRAFVVNPLDIIISCSGVNLGRLAILPPNARKGIINQALLKISLDQKKMNNDFFVFLFRHENFKKKFFGFNRGSGVPNFPPMSKFKTFKFIKPEIELQNKFSKIVAKSKRIKAILEKSLEEIENLHASISQKAFKGELDLSKLVVDEEVRSTDSPEESTTVSTENEEQPSIKIAATKPKGKRDIRNLTLLDHLGVPAELYVDKIADDYGPELDFIGFDLFYQFYLKDNFAEQAFTFADLHKKFDNYYIPKGQDFEPRTWKSVLYKFMEGNKPLIKQIFDEASGTIKLKLTDEAFKA
jgi:hypothetical protein